MIPARPIELFLSNGSLELLIKCLGARLNQRDERKKTFDGKQTVYWQKTPKNTLCYLVIYDSTIYIIRNK